MGYGRLVICPLILFIQSRFAQLSFLVLIAYTNHALDHMLTSVLDAGITEKVIRLGTRSSDERIAQYTLDNIEKLAAVSTFDRSTKRQYASMKQCEERLTDTMASIRLPLASWEMIEEFLGIYHADHYDSIQSPPSWIAELARLKWEEEDLEGEFEEVRRKGKKKWSVRKPGHRTMYGIWREGVDIHFLQQTSPASSKPRRGNQGGYGGFRIGSLLADPRKLFASCDLEDRIPPVPRTNRPLRQLLGSPNVWNMSLAERALLADEWEADIRAQAYESQLAHYGYMKEDFKEECRVLDEMRDEVCSLAFYLHYTCSARFIGPSPPAQPNRLDRMHNDRQVATSLRCMERYAQCVMQAQHL